LTFEQIRLLKATHLSSPCMDCCGSARFLAPAPAARRAYIWRG
jgi:hypothetical protein